MIEKIDEKTRLYFVIRCIETMNHEDFKTIHRIVVGEYLKRIK